MSASGVGWVELWWLEWIEGMLYLIGFISEGFVTRRPREGIRRGMI